MAKAKKEQDVHNKHKSRRGNVCRQLKAIALIIMALVRYYLDLLVDKLFGFYYDSKVEPLAKITKPLVLESATSLAQKIRKRELTSEEVVSAFIERIQQVNPLLNAVVDQRFDEAIKEARNLDDEILSGTITTDDFKAKPFLGLPFTTKDSTASKGLSNTFGLVSRRSKKASFDAEVVQRMKKAGAILIAVTNVPQLNLWQETISPVYGITCNPYNNTRTVGGSSGGEASIIAACGSPLGVGSDIGGSVRIPAFMCGIAAHKPTCNLISTNGLTFRTGKETDTMVVVGAMTKYCEDIVPFLKVLAGENISKLKLEQKVNLKDIKLYYIIDPKDMFVSPIRDEMNKILLKAVNHFTELLPDKPELLNIPELKFGGKLWRYWMTQEPGADFKRDLGNREKIVSGVTELLKFCVGQSEFNIATMFGLINEMLPQESEEWAKELTNVIHNKLSAILGTNGVLLYPSAPWPASYHRTALLRPWNMNLFAVWNALKFPVTQVPLGLNGEGLPMGLQVVAPPYQDHLTIAVATELEKAFGGYVSPSTSD